MTAERLIRLFEEMIDLKIQQHSECSMKASPDISRLLQDKRETDHRRLEQIRAELVASLQC